MSTDAADDYVKQANEEEKSREECGRLFTTIMALKLPGHDALTALACAYKLANQDQAAFISSQLDEKARDILVSLKCGNVNK